MCNLILLVLIPSWRNITDVTLCFTLVHCYNIILLIHNKLKGKRHLGNDVVLIIVRDGKNQPFSLFVIHLQFNQHNSFLVILLEILLLLLGFVIRFLHSRSWVLFYHLMSWLLFSCGWVHYTSSIPMKIWGLGFLMKVIILVMQVATSWLGWLPAVFHLLPTLLWLALVI